MALENPTNVDKEIDQGILRDYLGIEDGSDIDFGTYKTLIKEKITAARMGGSDMDSGDVDILTREFVRIKKIPVPDDQAKPKIDAKKFFAEQKKAKEKTEETEEKKQDKKEVRISQEKFLKTAQNTVREKKEKVTPKLLLPGTATPQEKEKEEDQQEDVKKGIDEVSLKLTDLEENLKSILETLKNQFRLDKEEEKKEDNLEAREKRKAREAKLEDKAGEKTDKSINKKVVKPVKGIFDMIMDFFKNILLGGALLFLLKLLQDPKKYLQPLVDAFNSVLEFFNGIIRAINGFINEFNYWILKPISNFVIGPIYGAFNFIEDRINDVLKLFGQNPLNNIPDQAPQIQIPKIPEIPLFDPFNTLPQNQQKPPPPKSTPAQGLEGGGIVLNNTTNAGDVNVTAMTSGGRVTGNTGEKVRGMGPDTQMVALQPGEIVMSKSAVQYHGANKLLAMNKEGGGTNVPKQGTVAGMQGGGMVALQPGEIVMNQPAVQYYGAENLLAMNKEGGGTNIPKVGTVTGMRGGGMVGYGKGLGKSPIPGFPNYQKPSDKYGQFYARMYKAAKKYGDPFPGVVAAQACEESAYGTSPLAKAANNLFGQDASSDFPADQTFKYHDTTDDTYHTAIKFKSPEDSIKYRVRIWKDYYGNAKVPGKAIRNIASAGYNPYEDYPGKIDGIMREMGIDPWKPNPQMKKSVARSVEKSKTNKTKGKKPEGFIGKIKGGLIYTWNSARKILGMQGGGYIGEVKKRDKTQGPNANKKIYLHWAASTRNSVGPYKDGAGYHTQITSGGLRSVAPYGSRKPYHTYAKNTPNAAGIAVSGMHGASEENYKSWGPHAITSTQYKGMAKEAAALATLWGWKPSDITSSRVRTHSEEYRDNPQYYNRNIGSHYRWDLNRLYASRKKNTGGDEIRRMIKSEMNAFKGVSGDPSGAQPKSSPSAEFKKAEGVDPSNFAVFQSMSEGQRSRFLSAQAGTTLEGTRVTSRMQFQLQKYLIAESKFKKQQTQPAVSAPGPSPVVSTSQDTRVAPGPRQPSTSVVTGPTQNGGQVPPGATPQSAASGGPQNTVPSFESTDSMNTETLIIKSIYSLVG